MEACHKSVAMLLYNKSCLLFCIVTS